MFVVMDLLNYMEKEIDFLFWFLVFYLFGILIKLRLKDIKFEVKVLMVIC